MTGETDMEYYLRSEKRIQDRMTISVATLEGRGFTQAHQLTLHSLLANGKMKRSKEAEKGFKTPKAISTFCMFGIFKPNVTPNWPTASFSLYHWMSDKVCQVDT